MRTQIPDPVWYGALSADMDFSILVLKVRRPRDEQLFSIISVHSCKKKKINKWKHVSNTLMGLHKYICPRIS